MSYNLQKICTNSSESTISSSSIFGWFDKFCQQPNLSIRLIKFLDQPNVGQNFRLKIRLTLFRFGKNTKFGWKFGWKNSVALFRNDLKTNHRIGGGKAVLIRGFDLLESYLKSKTPDDLCNHITHFGRFFDFSSPKYIHPHYLYLNYIL